MLKQRNQSGTGQKTSIVEVLMTPEISMSMVESLQMTKLMRCFKTSDAF